MSTINEYVSGNYYGNSTDYSSYTSKANSNANSFLSGLSISTDSSSSFNLSDWASIKNGSYGKLLKAYYKKQDAESTASGDTSQKLTLMSSEANALKKSADALNSDSLWEKKKVTKKDETTGEETTSEDYDWDAITKAVKAFAENYNDVIESASNSSTKSVLRNAAWMTSMTDKSSSLLSKAGITIGKGNKLSVDEEALKKADISTLKTLFTGFNSYANSVSKKAGSISNAANRAGGTYTSSATYSSTVTAAAASKVDEEV